MVINSKLIGDLVVKNTFGRGELRDEHLHSLRLTRMPFWEHSSTRSFLSSRRFTEKKANVPILNFTLEKVMQTESMLFIVKAK